MTFFFCGWIIFIYIVGVCIYVSSETDINFKCHKGGFLNMGYMTNDKRETLPRDVRRGLIWPLLLTWWMTVTTVWVLNDILVSILLIFGFRYKSTKLYQFINRHTNI